MTDLATAAHGFDPQVAGGWLLFLDMILCAALFAFWDKAGRIKIKLGKR